MDNITCNAELDSSCGDIFVPFFIVYSVLNLNDTFLGVLHETSIKLNSTSVVSLRKLAEIQIKQALFIESNF